MLDHEHDRHRARLPLGLRAEQGQTTAEYALVLIAAATIAMLIVAWAANTGAIGAPAEKAPPRLSYTCTVSAAPPAATTLSMSALCGNVCAAFREALS